MSLVIGLDVGTTALKGLLVRIDGRILWTATAAYPSSSPRPGWSEQDPEDWWRAAVSVCLELVAQAGGQGVIAAIGLSGQMHGSVFLDEHDRVLHPAILWNDQRTSDQCQQIVELTAGRIAEWTLNPPRTAFTASKILWVRQHRPDVIARTRRILLPKDYLRLRLTGVHVTDVSDASGTHLLDVARRRWSDEVLEALDVPRAWLPDVVESREVGGTVAATAASATGLPVGTPVVGGGADQAAAAIGNGVTRAGVTSLTLGTSGVAYAQIGEVTVDPSGAFHTFCHAVPGTWQMMAGVLSAGGSLRWFRDVVADAEVAEARRRGIDPYDVIGEAAAAVAPGSDGLLFLPYLTGERSPHNDPAARGGWFGLNARHGRAHLARAVIEGASFAMRDLVEVLVRLGVPVDELRVAGGGAKGALWLRVLADVLNRPLLTTTTVDASAFGAALLAASQSLGDDVGAVADRWVRVQDTIEPDRERAAIYQDYYGLFTQMYPATHAIMHRLSALAEAAGPVPEGER